MPIWFEYDTVSILIISFKTLLVEEGSINRFYFPNKETFKDRLFNQIQQITSICCNQNRALWLFYVSNGEALNKCINDDLTKIVYLGSHQITQIQAFYCINRYLLGLVLNTRDQEIARIGNTNTVYNTTMITLAEGEKWCGVASSAQNGYMIDFQFITARLK